MELNKRSIRSFLLLILLAVLVKAFMGWIYLSYAKGSGWVWHVQYDLRWSWKPFLEQIASGKIPYVDFSIEYPIGAGLFFWFLSFFTPTADDAMLMTSFLSVVSAIDVLNVGLLYLLLKEINPQRAFQLSLLYLMLPTALILGPYRFEPLVITFVILGYWCFTRSRPSGSAAFWGIGATLKWFPAFFFAIQEFQAFWVKKLRWRWIKTGLVFIGVLLLFNLPFLFLDYINHDSIDRWWQTYSFHMNRALSKDTILGVWGIWFGEPAIQAYSGYWTMALMAAAVLYKPAIPLAHKGVLVCIAALLLNKIYSPQFNYWFFPFLIFVLALEPTRRVNKLLILLLCIEAANMLIFPFYFTSIVEIPFGQGFNQGTGMTVVTSSLVVIRGLLLAVLAVLLLKTKLRTDADGKINTISQDPITSSEVV